MQIYERVTTISEPGFSGNLIKKKGLLFHKCQPSPSYPFWSLSSETQLYFCSSVLFCSPSHANIYAPQTKDGSCLSHWSGNRSERSGFLGQTAPRQHGWAPCHSTSHRVSVKWQSRQGHPHPAPPMYSCSSIYSNSLLALCCAFLSCLRHCGTDNLDFSGQY